MRWSSRRALTLAAVAATALAWSGCDAKKQTEYVAGVSTQVQVPRDLKSIRVDVSVGGVVLFCRGYKVYDGKVQLPRSLGEFPATGSPGPDPITVTVSGFTEEFSETDGKDVFANCTSVAPVVGDKGQGTRILRRSRQPYVLDSVLFLPMALKYSCFDKSCPMEDQTCKAGVCVDAKIDETKLPKFSDDLVDGTGGGCFSASQCFAAAVPAVPVDPDNCIYALPNTPSAPPLVKGAPPNPVMSSGDGINVQVAYDGGYNAEILDKDPDEGFTIPDPTKPQRFQLAAGLCGLVKGIDKDGMPTAHRITSIRATGLCQAKGPFQPLCANDLLAAMGTPDGVSGTANAPTACVATELKPAPSALVVLTDDTTHHHIFFDSNESANDLAALDIALKDPAFQRTDIALTFFPGTASAPPACSNFTNAVPFANALKVRQPIFTAFGTHKTGLSTATDVELGAAISFSANQLKAAYPTANRRGLLILGNRGFDDASTTCGVTAVAAATAAKANGVETYVTLLARDDTNGGTADAPLPLEVPNANAVALAGSPTGANLGAYDARAASKKTAAQDALRRVVEDLATCAYDATSVPAADDVLSYSDPVSFPPVDKTLHLVQPAAPGSCTTAQGAGNGWGVDAANNKRIRICGQACTDYRNVLKKASGWGLQYMQPSLAVPVFSHKKACAPTP